MTGTTTPNPPSDNFWSGDFNTFSPSLSIPYKKVKSLPPQDFLSSVDEAPDFYDPYSDLTLFLSQTIKYEMGLYGSCKKWSLKVQDELIKKITPEFQKRFPHFRLGVMAIKKTWDKIALYSQQLQHKKDSITPGGKLNIPFFIKENLTHHLALKTPSHLHPSHFAHQLALKMSEYIATLDGIRPKLDHLTKMIWSVQRHLLPAGTLKKEKSPYDEYDKIDKLIVKTILAISAKEPQISSLELEHQVRESLHALHDLPCFSSLDAITENVSALLAEKLYASSSFHTRFFAEQKTAIRRFIERHSALCKTTIPMPQLTEQVRRIIALYTLVSQLPKTIGEEEIKKAINACYPVAKKERPPIPQAVYAFISAELVLMRNEEYCHSPQHVTAAILAAYQETTLLPKFEGKEIDVLQTVIWKILSETEGLLEKLPYRIGQKIEEEIANSLIDTPETNFGAILHKTVQLFKRTKELILVKKWAEIERKIHTWVIQGDMLCRWIRLDNDTSLFKLIQAECKQDLRSNKVINHHQLVSEIAQKYLRQHPELAVYGGQLFSRIWILYKYIWYTDPAKEDQSSYERFLHWHLNYLICRSPVPNENHLLQQIEEIIQKTLPLIPLNKEGLKEVIAGVFLKAIDPNQ